LEVAAAPKSCCRRATTTATTTEQQQQQQVTMATTTTIDRSCLPIAIVRVHRKQKGGQKYFNKRNLFIATAMVFKFPDQSLKY